MTHTAAPIRAPVDVVIPAHQAADFIGDAILSVQRQSLLPNEIFVIADACTDRTAQIARSLNVHVQSVDYASVGAARNQGVELGKSPWIAFLDSDDLWKKDWLRSAHACIQEYPDADLLYGRVHEFTPGGETARISPKVIHQGDAFHHLFIENFIYTQAVVVRRDVFGRIGGFREDLRQAEDLDLWLRIAANGFIHPVDGVHVILRRTPGSLTRDPASFHQMRANAFQVLGCAATLRQVSTEQLRAAEANMYIQSAQRFLSFGRRYEARCDIRKALELVPGRIDWWAMAGFSTLPSESQSFLIKCRQSIRDRLRIS